MRDNPERYIESNILRAIPKIHAEIKIKYSHLNQGSLTQCYLVNKDSLVESILKENNRSCVITMGYLFCCNDVHISFIVQRKGPVIIYVGGWGGGKSWGGPGLFFLEKRGGSLCVFCKESHSLQFMWKI